MAEELQDLSKLKVADLRKELKSRGLSTVGNKNELMERLQVALGDNSFISESDNAVVDSEEMLDEDEVLAEDEEEEEETLDDLSASPEPKLRKLDTEPEDENKPPVVTTKKIVLNRTSSISTTNTVSEKENQQGPQEQPKGKKTEEEEEADGTAAKKIIKLSSISLKERLEMRAQKFGVELSADAKKTVRAARFGLSSPINTSNTTTASSDVLRKRAERFGITSSPVSDKNLSKAEMLEKLEKRKLRFNLTDSAASVKKVSTAGSSLLEDEKKKLRAERFKLSK